MSILTATMPYIEPGSTAQILISACFVAAGILFGVLLGRSRLRTENVLLVSGILLAASEVLKEVILYQIFGRYSWSDFPFQLCSMPMYFCILYYFFRKLWMEQFIMVFSLIGAVMSFLVPAGSYSVYVLLTFHSLFWHAMLLFLSIFLIFRQTREKMRLKNYIPVGAAYLILALAAILINSVFYNISSGTMNMFFIGPGWPDVMILNDIYTNSGWVLSSLGMIGTSEGTGLAVYILIWLLFLWKKPEKGKEFCGG